MKLDQSRGLVEISPRFCAIGDRLQDQKVSGPAPAPVHEALQRLLAVALLPGASSVGHHSLVKILVSGQGKVAKSKATKSLFKGFKLQGK
ncbi:MAG: hypothetical protein JKY65_28905 [Planctomycetes bacterium]|nr:hypothetical protein [Planctomycetota bacterium]